jgi:hypothetical protein
VTAIAPDVDRLRELEHDTQVAWTAYRDQLRDLTGEEYERAEGDSWAELQNALARVERLRRSLAPQAE